MIILVYLIKCSNVRKVFNNLIMKIKRNFYIDLVIHKNPEIDVDISIYITFGDYLFIFQTSYIILLC